MCFNEGPFEHEPRIDHENNRMSELQTLAPVDCEVVIYEAEEYVH